MFRSLTVPERRLVCVGAIVVAIVVIVTLASINRFRIFHAETDVRVLKDQFADYKAAQEAKERALRAELDEIARTIYASPDTPPPPIRRPSGVEQWSINRDKEIRERIQRLEAWRYRMESGR